MAAPLIVNEKPTQGDTGVSATDAYRFGVRDADTRADITSVHAALAFARVVYSPEADLPRESSLTEEATVSLQMFDDTQAPTRPGNPCAETIETTGTVRYRIEKDDLDAEKQEGVLVVTGEVGSITPFYAAAELAPVVAASGSYDYAPYGDFAGVVFGFIYWPGNTGIFLLFRDDGISKSISVVGPATDASGTRAEETTVTYDWSVRSRYTIFVDPQFRDKVLVHAAPVSTNVEVRLAEFDITALSTFLPGVTFGKHSSDDPPSDKIGMVLGLDSNNQGDYLDIYEFSLATFGQVLVYNGSITASAEGTITPTAVVRLNEEADADSWLSSGDIVVEQDGRDLVLSCTGASSYLTREEPDLAGKEWMIRASFSGSSSGHSGVYYTGLALMVRDGTKEYRLSLLDNFSELTLGLSNTTAADDPDMPGYFLPATATDWESTVDVIIMGSTARNKIYVFVDDEDSPVIEEAYNDAGFPVSTETSISVGQLTAGTYSGELRLKYFWLAPNAKFYFPPTTYPDAQGWTRVSSGGTRSAGAAGLVIDCSATVGAYDIYYVTDTTYDEESGVSAMVRGFLYGWTDAGGATSPVRAEAGPILALRTSTVSAQLRFVALEDGRLFAYLSNEESDYLDVLAQNTAGRAISTEVDGDLPHTYHLEVLPYNHVRLYLDGDKQPSIDVAWPATGALRDMPTHVPGTAVVAFGSLDENCGVKFIFSYVSAGIGKGYDFSAAPSLSEEDLLSRVYGSRVEVLVDVRDED